LNNIRETSWKTYLVIFLIYSVGGSIGEHLAYYFSKKVKIMKNPLMEGFPIYGIGAYMIVLIMRALQASSSNPKWQALISNWVFRFVLSAVALTAVEYIGGRIVGAGKSNTDGHVETWDYSGTFMNFQGIINLKHFLLHGVLGLDILQIHPYLVRFVNKLFTEKSTKNNQEVSPN
jgi:uncharacterized membrane protein